ncbi:MAG: MgtC/SapB family protein [Actinomycetaceae bacterium]|nr:MgtC/SapB family protein [Actinomycetaceae bacterium]
MTLQSYFWPALGSLLVATGLSGLVGLERQLRHKNAGIRTIALVGFGACLFTLAGKYGFATGLGRGADMSRIAAQVVSGVGFLGAGLIFVHKDSVRGLTTAASIWVSAAIGVACGAGLEAISVAGTAVYFVLTFALPPLIKYLPDGSQNRAVTVDYIEHKGMLRKILLIASNLGFDAQILSSSRIEKTSPKQVRVAFRFTGRKKLDDLVADIGSIPGVETVVIEPVEEID